MKIIALSCIHNDIENTMPYLDKISEMNPDFLVCNGDFTDNVFPKGFNRLDIAQIIIEELKSFNVPVFAVPGSWDKEIIELLEKEKISIHGKGLLIKKIGFFGFGGAKTPFKLPFEPDDAEIAAGLNKGFDMVKNAEIKIQVTHAPPARTKLDAIATNAHVGSEAVRNFIENKSPDAAISAHIHEARGVDVLGRTKLINPGRFPEGYCGLIEILDGEINVRVISLL